MKEIIDKVDFIQIKNFCSAKDKYRSREQDRPQIEKKCL